VQKLVYNYQSGNKNKWHFICSILFQDADFSACCVTMFIFHQWKLYRQEFDSKPRSFV